MFFYVYLSFSFVVLYRKIDLLDDLYKQELNFFGNSVYCIFSSKETEIN